MDCRNELCFFNVPSGHEDRKYYSQGCSNGREAFPECCGLPEKYQSLKAELESVKEPSCEGCKWFRFPACDHPDVCRRMETDHYEVQPQKEGEK